MMKLSTIQKKNNLNAVFVRDAPGVGCASHIYEIHRWDGNSPVGVSVPLATIQFQHGPRHDENSTHGVLDCDLLEIVRDRLQAFQKGEFATRENAIALTHIEEALLWMNKRIEDRAERGVLGTTKV